LAVFEFFRLEFFSECPKKSPEVILNLVQSDFLPVLKYRSYNAKIPSPANNQ